MTTRHTALLLTGSLLALAAPALAQTPATAPAGTQVAAADATTAGGIDDIVVTAQRREERLQVVPIAITAFSQDALTRGDVRDIARLALFTPGFNFGQSGFDTRPAIRGVRTDAVDGNGDTTVGFYVDDVYQSLAVQAGQPFVDVARVELARGPQGTLFGRNTFGGAISVVNALPSKELEAGADLTYGNYDRKQIKGFVSVPVSDTFGLRLAGLYEDRDPYVKNIVVPGNKILDRKTRYLRGTARWEPTDSLEVTLRGTYWHEGGTGAGAFGYKEGGIIVDPLTGKGDLNGTPFFFYTAELKDGIPDIPGSASCTGACRDIGVLTPTDPYTWQAAFKPRARLNEYAVNGQIKWSNDDIFVRSITSYQDFKYRSNTGNSIGSPRTLYIQDRNTRTYTEELQIGSVQTKPFQWVAGLYYFNNRYLDAFSIDDPTYTFDAPNLERTKSFAGYAQASYNVTDALRLTAGGRYTVDKKSINSTASFVDLTTSPPTAYPDPVLKDSDKFKKFTWRLGADYQVAAENLLYASVSTGFRSGGFNVAALTIPSLSPTFEVEKVTAYEIGSKNRFAGGRIQANVSFYYNDFKNLQEQSQFPLPAPSTSVISAVINAGAARAYGVEAELIWKPVPELTLNATGNLVNAKFTDFGFFGRPSRFYPNTQLNFKGNEIPHTPESKFTVGASYDIRIAGFGTITPQANALFSSHYYNTDYNTALDRQKAYTEIDASLGWTSENDKISVEGFVTNLTNKKILNYGAFGSVTLITAYEQPRFYGIRLSVRTR